MKKLVLATIACMGFLSLHATYQTPYYTDMATSSAVDADWSIIDANEDGNTWQLDNTNNNTTTVTGASAGVYYKYSNKNDANDWLISPAITLEAGKTYKVKFWTKTASNNEDYTLYMASSSEVSDLQSGTVVKDFASYKNSTWTQISETVEISETAEYHFGFYIHSAKGMYNVYLRSFYVAESGANPSAVTNLATVAGENRELSSSVTWTLPTTDDEGAALTGALDAVVVERNGEEIARLDGDATQFTDNADYGLTSGYHTYGVYVIYNGLKSATKTVKTGYVGPIEPIALPYSTDFNDSAEVDIWSLYDLDEDYKNGYFAWYHYNSNSLITGVLEIANTRSGSALNDWAVTPPLKIEKAGHYNLSFKGANNSSNAMKMSIYYGKECDPDALCNKITDITKLANQANPHSLGDNCSYDFVVAEPGTYYIGFYAYGDAAVAAQIRIDDLSVSAVADGELEALPYAAENVSETARLALPVGYIKVTTDSESAVVTSVIADNEQDLESQIFKNTSITEGFFKFDVPVNVSVSVSDQTPEMADAFVVNSSEDGSLIAKISYPAYAIAGDPLLEIESAEIYLNDTLIYTVEDEITPGTTKEYSIGSDLIATLSDELPAYKLVLSNMCGSSITDNGYTTAVSDITEHNDMKIYGDILTLGKASNITVYDISGKIIKRANNATCISLSELSHGVYIISANGFKTVKICK